MKKIILLFLSLFITGLLNAQSIKGRVLDSQNNPAEFVTVVLQSQDSIYINSTFTDSLGRFEFNSELKSFRLVIQHLMYKTVERIYFSPHIEDIILETQEHLLEDVTIQGERSVMKISEGRISYDVNLLVKDKIVNNAYEALLELPGVREQDNTLVLAGANGLSVILNGKPTTMTNEQLMDLLKSTPVERIERAEVMYSAPPQYHIRGAAINLILKKGTSDTPHLQGQVNAVYNQYHYDNYSAGTYLLYTSPVYSFDFLYSFGDSKSRSGVDLNSYHLYDGKTYDIHQSNRGYSKKSAHTVRFGNDFVLGENELLSLVYTGVITPKEQSESSSTGSFSDSYNKRKLDSPVQMHNASVSYKSSFGLDAGIDYTFYKSHTNQDYKENKPGEENTFMANTKQDINRISIYADQMQQFSEWNLYYGASFMYASDKSSQKYHSLMETDLPDSYSKMQEYTYDLYVGLGKNFTEKISANFSLTGEYYKYGNFDDWSLFPTFQIIYQASPEHIFLCSLSSDKVYPDYWTLTNSISYLNGYTELHGNPLLKPYQDYSGQLTYILKSKYHLTFYLNYQDDYFIQLPYQSPEKLVLIYKTTNFNYNQKTGINLVIPFKPVSFLDSRLTLDGFYHQVKSEDFHSLSFKRNKFSAFAALSNTINLSSKPNIKMELFGMYVTKSIQGPSELSGKMYKIDAGVKWISDNNKIEVRLKANDIFNSMSPDNWIMKLDTQNISTHIIPDLRHVSLSLVYKFNDYKEKKRKEVDTSRFN